jgi:ankyrin repeat protein
MASLLDHVRLLLARGADPNRGNDYGWTKLHQAGYGNDSALAEVMIDAGGRLSDSSRGTCGWRPVSATPT